MHNSFDVPPSDWVNVCEITDEEMERFNKEEQEFFIADMNEPVDPSLLVPLDDTDSSSLWRVEREEYDMQLTKFYKKEASGQIVPVGLLFYWVSTQKMTKNTFRMHADEISQELYDLAGKIGTPSIGRDDLYLSTINILPEQQNKGHGTTILTWWMTHLPLTQHIFISVPEEEDETALPRFYETVMAPYQLLSRQHNILTFVKKN